LSNTLHIRRTKFTDCEGVKYGYRAWDNYGNEYSDLFEAEPSPHDEEFFREVVEDGLAQELIDAVMSNETGVCIDATFYEFKTINAWMNNIAGLPHDTK
jgi:hypothetical protein